jgi:hypothetical protein
MQVRKLCSALAVVMALSGTAGAWAQPSTPPTQIDRAQFCAILIDPTPNGVTDRPATTFNVPNEYSFMHSSTHLQGQPATEKHAPGLFFTPPGPFSDFRSAVIVNNPSPVNGTNVTIQYFDTGGNPVGTTFRFLGPEQSYAEGAVALTSGASISPGLGSATITATQPIVGATIHHLYEIPGVVCDQDPFRPGAASLQQLQVKQANKTTLWWGPIPTSTTQTFDFLNGIIPLIWIRNPMAVPNNIQITYTSTIGVTIGPIAAVLPPNGTLLEQTLVNPLFNIYTSGGAFDANYMVTVTSTDGLPLLGEGIFTDFFGANMALDGSRFRIGSTMMANSRPLRLVNPELTYQVGTPSVTSLGGIWNSSGQDVGPVSIRYFNRNGGNLGVDNYANFPAGSVVRIGPGLGTPNYPAPGVFDGWMRITACKNGLVGWTMREVDDSFGFHKVYGETLHSTNGSEPGNGFPVTVGGVDLTRKVNPISQVWDESFFWPSYTAFVNESTGNIGPYFDRFHDFVTGIDVTDYTLQPFAGLRWAHTSFTYEDLQTNPLFSPEMVSGRVDHTSGNVKGIDAIGDPLFEYADIVNFVPPPPAVCP